MSYYWQPETKEGSLVPIWERIKAQFSIDPYLRICKSLGISIEETTRVYRPELPVPKIRLITGIVDTFEKVMHVKDAIADHVHKKGITPIGLLSYIALTDLRKETPPPLIEESNWWDPPKSNADVIANQQRDLDAYKRRVAGVNVKMINEYLTAADRWGSSIPIAPRDDPVGPHVADDWDMIYDA